MGRSLIMFFGNQEVHGCTRLLRAKTALLYLLQVLDNFVTHFFWGGPTDT